jgi:hypothetical protein
MRRMLLAIAALIAFASSAFAQAITFEGTLGKLPIIIELAQTPESADATTYGRYAYLNKGIDIPLHVTKAQDGNLTLREEVPCKADGSNCPHAGDDTASDPPLGASWTLELSGDGNGLFGKWTDNGKTLPVTLTFAGTRDFTQTEGSTPADLATYATSVLYTAGTIEEGNDTYDFLKMQVTEKRSGETKWGNAAFEYVTDPRTKFQFPRITDLGGADMSPANLALATRDYAMRADALNCRAMVYQGFGWTEYATDYAGTLGEYDNETVETTYLSPTMMSWTQSGSLYCGGAHPYNHHEFYNLDVKTGQPLDLSLIFKGWHPDGGEVIDARTHPNDFVWMPDATLADFVKKHRKTDAELGLDADSDCPIDEFIDTNLAISFLNGDKVLFSLDGLENAVEACGSDLYEAPIADLKDLLAPEVAEYFPSLRSNS